jgi:hypothetical protein
MQVPQRSEYQKSQLNFPGGIAVCESVCGKGNREGEMNGMANSGGSEIKIAM